MSYFDELDSTKRQLIEEHLQLVIEANKCTNLTRIDDIDEARILHIEDSLSGLPELLDAPDGEYADLGSGAGYPGVPLAIATGRKTTLVDARMKKMNVVKEILEELNLDNQIEVFPGRAELLARKSSSRYSVITARALSKIAVLLELASPLLVMGGHLICYKSNVDDSEMNEADHVKDIVGMRLISDRSFLLDNRYSRRILVYEKYRKSKVRLPRQEGMAQKEILK